jgi:gluconate:H+ symporter, GntP family
MHLFLQRSMWIVLIGFSLNLVGAVEALAAPQLPPVEATPENPLRSAGAAQAQSETAQTQSSPVESDESDANANDGNASDSPTDSSGGGPMESAARASEAIDSLSVPLWRPLLAMGLGVFVVLSLMIGLRAHAFIALILGALVISCFVPLDITGFVKSPVPQVIRGESAEPIQIVKRVTNSFGISVADIGILVAMAAIIGKCMLVSGAADRIVQSALATLGEKRAAWAMLISGFVLAIPVFFDTVFYLLVPLARSLYRRTGKNYLLYLGAIAGGGAITHTLVPPTPGPLLVANTLQADIGLVMLVGLAVGLPTALAGLAAATWLNRTMPIEMRPMAGASAENPEQIEFTRLPSLALSLVPVLLPVILITIKTIYGTLITAQSSQEARDLKLFLDLIGDANLAMILAALFAIYLCWQVQGHSLVKLAEHVEDALLSGGVIILITAAGGAFGLLLGMSQIQVVVQSLFSSAEGSGLLVLVLGYALSAILKVAQGSSTVAMIISSSLIASIALPLAASGELGFNPVYFVPALGAGSLMGSWMNDSGFWVFARMGVLTESETLRSWTVLLGILSLSAFLITLFYAAVFPMVG